MCVSIAVKLQLIITIIMYTLHVYNYVLIIVAVPLMHSTFGMGTGMIVEQIRCSGTERRLANCTIRDVTDGECDHNEDAGARCGKCHDVTSC